MLWFRRVDVGLRPRDIFQGRDVDVYPFTGRGAKWIEQNIHKLSDPVWSRQESCLRLSAADSSHLGLALIVSMLEDAGLKFRFYGRLKGWNRNKPWIGEDAER